MKKLINDSPATRWGIMVLVSIAMATNYYFYDALSPLKDLMHTKLGFSSSDYGLFMGSYSWANVFLAMAIVGGIILDKIGIRITGSLFILFQVAGAAITAYGTTDYYINGGFGYHFMGSFLPTWSPVLKMTVLGFFLFGLGAETTIVVISKVIVKWFKGKELALALGLNIAFGRLGMAAAMFFSPRLVVGDNISWPIWFSTMLLGIGFLAFLVYIMFDIKFDKQVKSDSSLLDETEIFRLSDIWKLLLNRSFIFITLLCVLFYSAVFPFVKFAPDLMINKFGVSREMAGTIVTVLPFGTLFFTPLFAWVCDFKGKSATLMLIGSFLLVLVHTLFAFTNITPYITMFILGVAFSLVPAAMWPSVAKIVDTSKIGTAYGLMFTVQNIGLMIFPMLIGYVLDNTNPGVAETLAAGGEAVYNYTYPSIMLAGLGVLGVIFAFLLKREDQVSGYGLELPNKVNEIVEEVEQVHKAS
jgi:MFS family permease